MDFGGIIHRLVGSRVGDGVMSKWVKVILHKMSSGMLFKMVMEEDPESPPSTDILNLQLHMKQDLLSSEKTGEKQLSNSFTSAEEARGNRQERLRHNLANHTAPATDNA